MISKNEEREVLLEVNNLNVTFEAGKKIVEAVKDASFKIYRGETFALVGESGSGKTTIGRSIIRLNSTQGGDIIFKGKKINKNLSKSEARQLVREVQMIFQDPAASLNERVTVDHCVAEGIDNFHLYENKEDRARKVDETLEAVGLLPEHKSRYPHEFSGGQRQRIGIARAIIMEPEFIIADEPISALDVSIRAQVMNLLNTFKEERGLTYLFIAHDLSVVRYFSDRIAVIREGEIVEVAETDELFAHPLHPYTLSLLQSVPVPDPQIEKSKSLITYEPKVYGPNETLELQEVVPGHYVYCTKDELTHYHERYERLQQSRISNPIY